jgi:hypothetical protein
MDENPKRSMHMNNSVFKKSIFLLVIVLSIFFLSACETMKAAVSFKWGKRTNNKHNLEAKKAQKECPSTSCSNPSIMKGPV